MKYVLTEEPQPNAPAFTDGDFMAGLWMGGFLLELYQLRGFQPPSSHTKIGYRLFDMGWRSSPDGLVPIFEGRDCGIPNGCCIDDPRCFAELAGFLSMQTDEVPARDGLLLVRDDETDDEYFKDYTKLQLHWQYERASSLGLYATDLEEQLASIWNDEVPSWACAKYQDSSHHWLGCADCGENWDQQAVWQEHNATQIYLAAAGSQVLVRVPIWLNLPVPGGPEMKQLSAAKAAIEESFLTWIKQAAAGNSILTADIRLQDLAYVHPANTGSMP